MAVYTESNFGPVAQEVTAFDLEVIGQLPRDLNGRYLRNGPNPIDEVGDLHHWFVGDGMVHGIRIGEGVAKWYRNRYVRSDRTQTLLGLDVGGVADWSGSTGGPNTNVGGFAGTTWAMIEAGGTPVTMSYDLDDMRRDDFGGTLNGAFSAHPKYDPLTGELHAMTYAPRSWWDHCRYVVVGSDGGVDKAIDIPMGMSMVHDMSLTTNFAIVFDFPVTFSLDDAIAGRPLPYRWNPDYGSRIGVLPRTALDADGIVWIDAPICYAFHPLNSYETADGDIVIDICVFDRIFADDLAGPFGDTLPRLQRWTVNPQQRTVSVRVVDERPVEFPRHAPRVGTTYHRFGYATEVGERSFGATVKFDLETGVRSAYEWGPGRGAGEAVFVPRQGNATADEDDGWLMTFTHAHDGTEASFVVLDAQDLERGPVAEVRLPQRVPYGFHGNWVSDASVPPT